MGNYLHKFLTNQELTSVYKGYGYLEPWVSYTYDVERVDYNNEESRLITSPLTFNILSDGNIIWKCTGTTVAWTIRYSINGEDWIDIKSTTSGATIPVVTGDVVKFKGYPETLVGTTLQSYNYFSSTCKFSAEGNPFSLEYGDKLVNWAAAFCFNGLFKNCSNLIDISKLKLPATRLNQYCYSNMFSGCTGLTSLPKNFLPAITMAPYCYMGMFYGCSGLTSVPQDLLPATTLANGCYRLMFNSCNHLINAPDLCATTLVSDCYVNMFVSCASLTSIKCLATDIPASGALSQWLNGVSSTGTFTKAAGVTWPSGASGIPQGWTVLEE